jgi:hypothetical protein
MYAAWKNELRNVIQVTASMAIIRARIGFTELLPLLLCSRWRSAETQHASCQASAGQKFSRHCRSRPCPGRFVRHANLSGNEQRTKRKGPGSDARAKSDPHVMKALTVQSRTLFQKIVDIRRSRWITSVTTSLTLPHRSPCPAQAAPVRAPPWLEAADPHLQRDRDLDRRAGGRCRLDVRATFDRRAGHRRVRRGPTQPRFAIGHSLLLRGRAASSAGTVASSLR